MPRSEPQRPSRSATWSIQRINRSSLPDNPVPEGAWWLPINLVRIIGMLSMLGALMPPIGEGVDRVRRRWAAWRKPGPTGKANPS